MMAEREFVSRSSTDLVRGPRAEARATWHGHLAHHGL
jgi:hypothetical protein